MRLDITWAQRAYGAQKTQSIKRGIGWQFTFEEWLLWWGDDLMRRGTSRHSLQMQRIADSGPYSPSNTVKGMPARNQMTKKLQVRNRNSAQNAIEHQNALNALPVVADDGEEEILNPLGFATMWQRLERDSVRQSDKNDEPSNTCLVIDR